MNWQKVWIVEWFWWNSLHYLHAPCLALRTHRVTSQRKLALAEPWGLCPLNSFLFRWTDCKMAPFLSFTVPGQGRVLTGPHWQASRFILQGARWFYRLFPSGSVVKILLANAGNVRDASSITGSGRPPGGGHSNLLQYSCWENHMDRGAWWTTVHRVIKSQTWPKHPHMQGAFMRDTTCTDLHNSPAGAVSLSRASFLVFIYRTNVCEMPTVYPLLALEWPSKQNRSRSPPRGTYILVAFTV